MNPAYFSASCIKLFTQLKNVGGRIMDFIEVAIKDFKSLVKRRDIVTPQWFAVEHNLLLHPDFLGVSGDEVKAFLWICGTATHLNKDVIRVYPKLCAQQIAIPEAAVLSSINKLSEKRWNINTPYGSVRNPNATVQNSTEQYSTEQGDSTVVEKSTPAPIEAKFSANTVDELLSTIPEQSRNGWLGIYDSDEDFIVREIKKAFLYYAANPKKKPKSKRGWLTALSSWLERGWGYRAKNTAGKKPTDTFKNAHLVDWANESEEGA
jgi:hypothetical protein